MISRRSSISSYLILAATLAVGCSKSAEPMKDGRPVRSDQVVDFKTLFGQHCAGCHGADGQFGPASPINDPLFLAIVPDSVLLSLVTEGRPGTPMPAFSRPKGGTLTDKQVRAIATGIKQNWKAESPPTPPPTYLAGKGRGLVAAERGQIVFDRACASCHGANGNGGKDKVGPINDPSFLALVSDQAIRRYVITGRRDLKMPDYAGKTGRSPDFTPLTPTEIGDVVALLSNWRTQSNHPPIAGSTD